MIAEKKKTLFEFIRERIVPINAVIALSVTLALILDFFAPKAPYLAWISYGLAALVMSAMLAELLAPAFVGRWLERTTQGTPSLIKRMWMGQRPVWRSPAWQTSLVVMVVVLILGQVSKAKAGSGGFMASQFPSIADAQAALFDLKKDTQAIKEAVKEIQTSGKYEGAGDALQAGDLGALKAFIGRGQPLPPANTVGDFTLASGFSYKRADRFDLMALYLSRGFDINERGTPLILSAYTMPKTTDKKLSAWWMKKTGTPFFVQSCEFTLLQVATITDDKEGYVWLVEHGANPLINGGCKPLINGHGKSIAFTTAQVGEVVNFKLP